MSNRITSIDALRGVAIILMICDHARHFFNVSAISPTDIAMAPPALFFTRWITHPAPVMFIFLAGVSIFLYGERRKNVNLRSYLLRRGLMLAVLEVSVIKFCWNYRLDYTHTYLQVIWAIGCSMCLMAFAIRLRRRTATVCATLACFSPVLCKAAQLEHIPIIKEIAFLLFVPGNIVLFPEVAVHTSYPIFPWFGIMLLGWLAGPLFSKPLELRQKLLVSTSVICISGFIITQLAVLFSTAPLHTAFEYNWVRNTMQFLHVDKYPPSIRYMLLTFSITALALYLIDRLKEQSLTFLTALGRFPLMIYLGHLLFLQIFRNAIVWYPSVFKQWNVFNAAADGYYQLYQVYLAALGTTAVMLALSHLRKNSMAVTFHPKAKRRKE